MLFNFSAKFYDNFFDRERCSVGVVYGEDYTSAVKHVVDFIGEKELIKLTIQEFDDLDSTEYLTVEDEFDVPEED